MQAGTRLIALSILSWSLLLWNGCATIQGPERAPALGPSRARSSLAKAEAPARSRAQARQAFYELLRPFLGGIYQLRGLPEKIKIPPLELPAYSSDELPFENIAVSCPNPPHIPNSWNYDTLSQGTFQTVYARRSALEVLKVRRKMKNSELYFQRDLILHRAFKEVVSKVRFNGAPLARFAENLSELTPEDYTQGYWRMEKIVGPSAAQLAKEGHHLEQLKALQELYFDLHGPVQDYLTLHKLPVVRNQDPFSGQLMEVGLDFNHGKNVLYDEKNQIFVIIDF